MALTIAKTPGQMVAELVGEAGSVNVPRFIALTYRNEAGELSNYSLLIGLDMVKAYQRDLTLVIKFLQRSDISPLHRKAAEAIGESLAMSLTLGIGYNPAYVHGPNAADSFVQILPGIDVNKGNGNPDDAGTVYLMAYSQKKTVIEKGEYKHVNSKPLTIAKREVKKMLNLRTERIRRFKLREVRRGALNGRVLILATE